MGETTAVAHGGNGSRSWGGAVCGTCVRTCLDAIASGGNPQDRAASL
ncbi:hypothetical protein [Moorena producens]